MYLEIDLDKIFVDCGSQVEVENRKTFDINNHGENDGKKKGIRVAKESFQDFTRRVL